MKYIKAVGSNPLHFRLRIQQLVQSSTVVEQYLKKKIERFAGNGHRKEGFRAHKFGNGIAGPQVQHLREIMPTKKTTERRFFRAGNPSS